MLRADADSRAVAKRIPIVLVKPTRWRFELVCAILLVGLSAVATQAQYASPDHSFKNARLPVGEIGRLVLNEQPQLNGVMQPVLLRVPKGARVFVAEGAGFAGGETDAALVSLEVGQAYRLKVANIPNQFGDVYPTVELIGRMHPPAGKETRYPIPIHLSEDELAMAMRGKFVTRVIYVEDPKRALGVRELPDDQRYFEVAPYEDPYRVANRLGRPVAILRMGSVAPASTGPTAEFLFNSPPVQRHAMAPTSVPYVPRKLDPSDLPTPARQRELLPAEPSQPEVQEETPEIPEALPERDELLDAPGEVAPGEVAPDEDPAGDVDDVAGDDSPFEDDDDPFGGLDDADGDLGDDLDGDLFD